MAYGVTRVIERCDNAKETENLDLSACELIQVPDAVFLLMKNTELKSCNFSSNQITNIPTKLPLKFSCITDLNVSHNRLSKLPDELAKLECLERLNISYNGFVSFPQVILTLPKLENFNAERNQIAEVRNPEFKPSLKRLNLLLNPLTKETVDQLISFSNITVLFTQPSSEFY